MSRGGKRPGSGRKPGGKNQATIEREQARKLYEQRILQELGPLMRAQFNVAMGVTVMFTRDLTTDNAGRKKPFGPWKLVTDPDQIEAILNSDGVNGEDFFYINTREPNGKVLEDLFSRVFGTAKQTIEHDVTKETKEALEKLAKILP